MSQRVLNMKRGTPRPDGFRPVKIMMDDLMHEEREMIREHDDLFANVLKQVEDNHDRLRQLVNHEEEFTSDQLREYEVMLTIQRDKIMDSVNRSIDEQAWFMARLRHGIDHQPRDVYEYVEIKKGPYMSMGTYDPTIKKAEKEKKDNERPQRSRSPKPPAGPPPGWTGAGSSGSSNDHVREPAQVAQGGHAIGERPRMITSSRAIGGPRLI